jgi:flagellar hook protein FlgE
MDVIGNNIANVNTTGFKTSRVNFQEMFSQNIRGNSISNIGINSVNPSQIGLGQAVSSIDSFFAQGAMQVTGRTLDMAVDGNGFFMLQDAQSGQNYYTRDGAFYLNTNGDLVNSAGLYVLDSSGNAINLGTDISALRIDKNGKVYVNGSETEAAIIGIGIVTNPEGLLRAGNNLYVVPDNTPNPGEPMAEGRGVLLSGNLEMSNVDLTNEFANMIVTQRAYQASARVITTSDQMLQELVDLKR